RPRGRADHAVGGQAVVALEVTHGARRPAAEDAIGRDAEETLKVAHRCAAVRAATPPAMRGASGAPARMRPLQLEHLARVAYAEGRPGGRTDDAVGLEAMAALEDADGVCRVTPEHAVGGNAERTLEPLHPRAVHVCARHRPRGGVMTVRRCRT